MIRVAIADDQELSRDGFEMIVGSQPDLTVVGTAADGRQAVELVRDSVPDVVLMDVRMPVLDGIEATRQICAAGVPTRVLALTTYDLDEYVYEVLRAGASGFLLKDVPRAVLADSIRRAHAREVVLAPSVTRRVVAEFVTRRASPQASALEKLSPREQEILRLVATGATNAEIAEQLFVALPTVKTHLARAMAKLALRDRVHAVIWAYEHGVVRPGD